MRMALAPLFFLLFAFSAAVHAQHCETKLLRGVVNEQVSQWATVEIGLRFPAQERLYRTFLEDHNRGVNPYAVHSIRMQFICRGKTYTVPAFYMQEATADEASNQYVPHAAEWPWRVRFAVPDTGDWQCLVLVGDPVEMAVPQPASIHFRCVPGNQHGFLRTAPDQRHLEFTDHTPFFAIGQNVAWADDPLLRGKAGPYPVYLAGFYDIFHYIDNLGANGGNYVRVIMAPWSSGIEWEEAGVYHQGRAAAMDSLLRICEARGIYIHLTVEMQSGYEEFTPPYGWDYNPYRKALGLTSPVQVLTNDSAQRLLEQKFRYIEARWGYSPNIAVIEFLSEMTFWTGYREHEAEFVAWHERMAAFLRKEVKDTLHLFSSCFGPPPIGRLFDSPSMQVTSIHHYDNNFWANRRRFDLVDGRNFYYERRGMRARYGKPFIFGEMGMIAGPVNACDPDDWEHCSDWSFHNALWATAFSGSYGTGLNWWQWKNDAFRAANFPALRWFIDTETRGMRNYNEPHRWDGNGLEAYYLVNDSSASAVGWVHNTSYWWANNPDSCADRSGKKMLPPKDDDRAARPESRKGNTFKVSGLQPRKSYRVCFYDTRRANQVIACEAYSSDLFGNLHIRIPDVPDCAFKVFIQKLQIR